MKKKLFTFLGLAIIGLFVGYTPVRAESNVYTIDNFYDAFNTYSIVSDTTISDLKTAWQSEYSLLAPYYIIYSVGCDFYITGININKLRVLPGTYNQLVFQNGYVSNTTLKYDCATEDITSAGNSYSGSYLIYESSTDLVFDGGYQGSTSYNVDKIIIPSYENNTFDASFPSYELYVGDEVPTYKKLSDGTYDTYQTIRLNDYAYVVLSLLDYEQDSFWTNIYTQGRLCLTPVYNYGMTERKDIMTGTQVQSCTTTYETLSPVNVSILQSDIDNHAVYYVAAYNNEATTIKVDTSVFSITYVSSSEANNPNVIIGGRSYPVIPYSQLSDSATISTDENYVSGQVCSLGDVNCASEVTGIDISDLWTSPLQLFKTLGTSITSVLGVISAFIMFLPPTLQAFLYTSFFLVIILGIVKVIL